ncbi:hypothetical protein Rsub_07475 [Raphidocelis subcapitata]|uniref:B box-type domain-containing protein n=1 Tax=Raphidocelis subcapitata TaxID=307507 RepID=A0A2V0P528_9CHLO|nr:hypothetical protein Rsub_07475 [Raphidocelis subcapitata]|eukprot:GBF94974.1 hypothetical protein Rsub_07475 [Raphidocelis subcapitata]
MLELGETAGVLAAPLLCWSPVACGLAGWPAPAAVESRVPSRPSGGHKPHQIAATKQRTPHGKGSGVAAAPAPHIEGWLRNLIETSQQGSFFNPCLVHKELRKSEATLFCVDCDAAASTGCRAMCQHCVPAHGGHRTIQIRRYVYCDVVRAADIAPFVDIVGVQTYTINQAKVVFLNCRPQAKLLPPGSPEGCAICARALREGCTYCSLSCKVEALVREGRLGPGAVAGGSASGCCGDAGAATAALANAAALADAAAAAASPAAAASESSDCCTFETACGAGAGACGAVVLPLPPPLVLDASLRRSSSSGSDQATGRRGSASDVWAAKRSSDSSCQSHLDWHGANGHVCRRKQASPRRSPLL